MPDYDGRGNVDAKTHRRWSWIPRVVLWPAYALNEYVVRWPLGLLTTRAERDRWLDAAIDIFSFGPQHDILVFPIASYEWGFRPNAGLYFTGDNMFVFGNALRMQAAFGGEDYVSAAVLDRYALDAKTTLSTRFDYARRSDLTYYGLGPDVTSETRARYGLAQIDGNTNLERRGFGESHISVSVGARAVGYRNPDCCSSDPSIDARVAAGTLAPPPGYREPYTVMYERADLVLDSRAPRPAPGTGAYLRLHERTDFDEADDRGWFEYGGAVGGALDLDGLQRTLRLQLALDFVDPIAGLTPFNELATLGSDLMPGFAGGWMIGRSTAATQLSYTWPVSVWFDGEARLAAGNAFDAHLHGLTLDQLRVSGDVGLTSNGARDQGFEVVFGLGTEPIGMGANITSVRIAVGTRAGF